MFSGIIEEIGCIENIETHAQSKRVAISCKKVLSDVLIGDSISVNGVCLTITKIDKNLFYVDIIKETLNRSNLGDLDYRSYVNLERAMMYNQRVSGHLVQGHVDTQAEVIRINKTDEWTEIDFSIEPRFKKYCIEKGSIAIDGVSLTIASINDLGVKVALIPHTLSNTILSGYKLKQKVNIETDMVGKFIENFSGMVN